MWARELPRAFGPSPGLAEDLGRDDHVLAAHLEVPERLPGDLLRAAAGIDVGRVDEVDPGFQRAGDQPLGLVLPQRADLAPHPLAAAERHGAEAQLGDEEAGLAQPVVAHGGRSLS